jgi:putative hydrolase of the HAD superfamily
MTVLRTTEHNDTDPAWDGPVFAALGDLPLLLRDANVEVSTSERQQASRR